MVNPRIKIAWGMVMLVATSSAAAETRYAKVSGGGTGACTAGWESACTFGHAIQSASAGDEIWVQAGVYAPFVLKNAVKIIGGFAGSETRASQSDPRANLTIVNGRGSRAVVSRDQGPSTMLRGWVIRNGHADGPAGGGGLLLKNSSALIVQCVFVNNTSSSRGAAVSVHGVGSPRFINCIFHNNGTAGQLETIAGGAIFVQSGSPSFSNCLFHKNRAGNGAALFNNFGVPALHHCTLVKNVATTGRGGAIHDREGRAVVSNSVLWGNTAASGDQQIHSPGERKTSTLHCNIQGGWSGVGNIDADPRFNDESADDYTVPTDSPCRNQGRMANVPYDLADLDWDGTTTDRLPRDLAGKHRRMGSSVDIGAFENQWQRRRRVGSLPPKGGP